MYSLKTTAVIERGGIAQRKAPSKNAVPMTARRMLIATRTPNVSARSGSVSLSIFCSCSRCPSHVPSRMAIPRLDSSPESAKLASGVSCSGFNAKRSNSSSDLPAYSAARCSTSITGILVRLRGASNWIGSYVLHLGRLAVPSLQPAGYLRTRRGLCKVAETAFSTFEPL